MNTHQPALLPADSAERRFEPEYPLVAQVLVHTGLAHLDRPFDYAVPADLAAHARPGVRVKVRFAGTEREGFVIGVRRPQAGERTLIPLRRVVSDLPVLTEHVLDLCHRVARRYAGTTTDVLRLAIPPRHATAEKAALDRARSGPADDASAGTNAGTNADGDAGPGPLEWDRARPAWPSVENRPAAHYWEGYRGGAAFLRRLAAGDNPRAVWSALPWEETVPGDTTARGDAPVRGDEPVPGQEAARRETGAPEPGHWARAITQAILATCAAGRSVVAVLPDQRDVRMLSAALDDAGVGHEVLTAEQGRSARYRRFVLALTGQVQVVIGTRSAAFAPVPELGLVICWDDGDDTLAELRAPYPHARTVLAQRADLAGAAALIGGYSRTPEAELLVQQGWARSMHADRASVRRRTARVQAPGDVDLEAEGPAGRARIPGIAWRTLRTGLASGPVLVQVPRAGYVPATSCAQCRTPAHCATCHGRLRLPASGAVPTCGWCGRIATGWTCRECGHQHLRAARVGSNRTAEELGRAFPGVPVQVSGRDGGVLTEVDDKAQLVVATPGAEPVAAGGYYAAALLDAAATTERPELDAGVEALRRWLRAAALVRPAPEGQVVLVGHGAPVPSQALVRWDPTGLAERELSERAELDFPPQVHMASLQGPGPVVRQFLRTLQLPDRAEVLGPVESTPARPPQDEAEPMVRALVRAPLNLLEQVNTALIHNQAHRSARKEPGPLRVQVDPVQLW